MLNTIIPVAGMLAAGYLIWLATWLVARPKVKTVSLRSLHRISGYRYQEGQRNGGSPNVA